MSKIGIGNKLVKMSREPVLHGRYAAFVGWLLSLIFCVMLALPVVALPLGIALAQGKASPVRTLPQVISPGATFEVKVTFTAPADMFNAIGLSDTVPEGWDVTVDASWCKPVPDGSARVEGGNTAQFIWIGPFDRGTKFEAVYKITVPQDASVGSPAFDGELEYYIGNNNHVEVISTAGAGAGGGGGAPDEEDLAPGVNNTYIYVGAAVAVIVLITVIISAILALRQKLRQKKERMRDARIAELVKGEQERKRFEAKRAEIIAEIIAAIDKELGTGSR